MAKHYILPKIAGKHKLEMLIEEELRLINKDIDWKEKQKAQEMYEAYQQIYILRYNHEYNPSWEGI